MAEVETSGTGQVERIADRAVLQVTYTHQARDRTGAVAGLADRIRTAESVLDRDGVQVRDRRLSVHDVWHARRRSGAQADQSYQVRITDIAALNDLIADVMATEPAGLNGPFWELAEETEATHEAQRHAVADATRRAEGYLRAMGRQLGPLLRITDDPVHTRNVPLAMNVAYLADGSAGRPDTAALSLEPQLVTVVAGCTMVWEISD